MDKNQRTMCESIQMFNQGKFDSVDLDVQIEAGWVDWFCRDSSLRAKTKKLYQKIKQIADSKKFDKNKVYVSIKNNCPMNGTLYDSFSIVDIETDDVLFGWNGTYKGEPQPMSTFVWTCSYYDTFEKRQKDRVGNITLIR